MKTIIMTAMETLLLLALLSMYNVILSVIVTKIRLCKSDSRDISYK